MEGFEEKYINLFTDFGFKKLFGEEPNKNLLLDFLNELLREQEENRKAIFDLYCVNDKGEKFIVELQKTKQNFFKERSVYYATFPIREQVKKGKWNYELKAVYTIAILDFIFEEDENEPDKYRYDVKLSDIETHKVFYNKLTFIYLEMPKFQKTLEELETRFDKWMYIIRNLERLQNIPSKLQEQVFEQLFEAAEIAKLDQKQLLSYEDSLKYYRDLKNSLDTAFDEGKEEGLVEGALAKEVSFVLRFHSKGMDISMIAELTGLSEERVKEIIKN
ncbi:MAG: PD-(D/E)XK nuclease family transposase [Cytophagales bacterium]|nr:PD-(D/E)XK nuclease family transposase [Cytophagales bacterium]